MLENRLKLYKYPLFFAFLSFWTGIFTSLWGFYAIIGFLFGALLLRYIFGRDFLYTFIFFIAGFLYTYPERQNKIPTERVAVTATVMRKGVIRVDSVIGGNSYFKGKSIRVKGLSGFERGDIIRGFMIVNREKNNFYARPIKLEKVGVREGFPYSVNRYLKAKIEEVSDREDVRGFLLGVLLGYRDFIPINMMDTFKKTGTMHILALSGLHIGILLTIIYFLFIPILGHKNRASVVAIILTLLYILIVGTSPSILRAYIVFVVIMISRMFNRRTSVYNAIGIAGILSLLIWPDWAFSYSFMLSYLAFVGVVYYSSVLNAKSRYLAILLASIGAMLFTLPITSHFSGYIPALSFAFNLVIIPLFSAVMWIFAGALFVYIVAPFFIPLLNFIVNTAGRVFLGVISVFSHISPLIKVKIDSPAALVCYYLVILALPVIITILKERRINGKSLNTKGVFNESS